MREWLIKFLAAIVVYTAIMLPLSFVMRFYDIGGHEAKRSAEQLKAIKEQHYNIDCRIEGNRLVCNNGQEFECPKWKIGGKYEAKK